MIAIAELTARQREIAELVAAGLTDKQIAALLRIHASTVRAHVVAIEKRLLFPKDLNTRVLITRWWMDAA